jgi:predicted DsbA family dithiol-disulfide isomerase
MRVDIWSDIMCPFCYIGKRQFESALSKFAHKDTVEIVWHSFQLDPSIEYQEGIDLYTYLADRKGQSREWSVKAHESVAEMAKQEGLDYNFDIAKVANSFDAHRVIQYAKTLGLADAIEERFFMAYFMEGAIMSDPNTLIRLATEVGLNGIEVAKILTSDNYSKEVNNDILDAQKTGINGVPFFLFDSKYAVSGARGIPVFSQALNQTYDEFYAAKEVDGQMCWMTGECV